VDKVLKILLIFIFFTNCSLDNKSGIWTKKRKIKSETPVNIKELFKKEKALGKEFNSKLEINLSSKLINNSFINNFNNNNGRINYDGDLKSISKFKFSKIKNFYKFEPEIIFEKNNVIFFDNKGSILKFDNLSKLIWKKNFYSKLEKKQNPILLFSNNDKILIATDNLSKYFAMNIKTGELLWSKNSSMPFNSQVKIYKNKFFAIDFENTLICYSIIDGTELWRIRTDKSFINSQQKLSLIIVNNMVIFNNSIGDITAVEIKNGNLIWQTPTQSSAIYENAFFLKTSDIIANKKSVLFSNNKNEFFSIDIQYGTINWKQKINSNLRPTVIDNFIFTITLEGFLVVLDVNTGNIIRINDVFYDFKEKKRSKIKPVGFIIGANNVYLTTDNGKLIIIDIITGLIKSILKIDNEKISRPFVSDHNLFIIKNNSIIKLN
jgi:outer membrane protein assembly factor BamB